MNELKCLYNFDIDQQYLKIEFLPGSFSGSWQAFVFDENWTDMTSAAASISEILADSIEFVFETLGVRGRVAVLNGLEATNSLESIIETSLFHLQGLLFVSAIIVNEDMHILKRFGFAEERVRDGHTIYVITSEEESGDSCRFL
ncbi:hypothetical protein M3204_07320 [Mesobacillus subterraneus]|uniref:hypothetical protein n=1 Tax=Mesobacillus subterraneus TaxID=285983 RepID=UPI00203CFFF8|nr:hypothetical protein [Mesobacillus subterraneus]MCM3664208.1 hypothetical protein [Mesobacillus subterraneus]MCM3682236.1 hypothetical protein [Mesobacillus subterraneus]